MLSRIVFVFSFSFFISGYTLAASFTTLNEFMNWNDYISDAIVSDDASTIVISYGSGENALWKLGALTLLPSGSINGITQDGSVLVGKKADQAFTYQSGIINYLDIGVGISISNDGNIVAGKNKAPHDSSGQACIWNNGVRQDLGFLSGHTYSASTAISGDGQTVVGYSRETDHFSDYIAFIWSGAAMEPLPAPDGFESWYPRTVSNDGSMVVGSFKNESLSEACIYNEGTNTRLGMPESYIISSAYDLSADGSLIVGSSAFPEKDGIYTHYRYRATIWDDQNGARLLKSVLEDDWNLDLTDWTLEHAYGISENGSIIYGDGIDPDGNDRYWIAEIPEPTTLLLMMAGGCALIRKKVAVHGF